MFFNVVSQILPNLYLTNQFLNFDQLLIGSVDILQRNFGVYPVSKESVSSYYLDSANICQWSV